MQKTTSGRMPKTAENTTARLSEHQYSRQAKTNLKWQFKRSLKNMLSNSGTTTAGEGQKNFVSGKHYEMWTHDSAND